MRAFPGMDDSKSFLLSPQNKIDFITKPTINNSSLNTSFDLNNFSFTQDESGSAYYAFIGPDGQTSSLVKIGD